MKEVIKKYIEEKKNTTILKRDILKNKCSISIDSLRLKTPFLDQKDWDYNAKFSKLDSMSIEIDCRLYHIYHDIVDVQVCPNCEKSKLFLSFNKGYDKTCGDKVCRRSVRVLPGRTPTFRETVIDLSIKDKVKAYINSNRLFALKNDIKNEKEGFTLSYFKERYPFVEKMNWDLFATKSTVRNVKESILSCYVWHEYNDKIDPVLCEVCGDYAFFSTFEKNYIKTCGKEKCIQDHAVIARIDTSQDRFGEDYPWQNKEIRDKVIKIFDEKYKGHPLRMQKYLDKQQATNLEKYGVKYLIEDVDWREKKMMKKYGVSHQMYLESTKEKIRETNIERYGGTSPMHDIKIFEKVVKASYKLKDYKLPSGRVVRVQGYEPLVLDALFEEGYMEDDIVIDNREIERYIGKIHYTKSDGSEHRYYPDICVVSEGRVIEVKSEYTFEKNRVVNLLKGQACMDRGLKFEFVIL